MSNFTMFVIAELEDGKTQVELITNGQRVRLASMALGLQGASGTALIALNDTRQAANTRIGLTGYLIVLVM